MKKQKIESYKRRKKHGQRKVVVIGEYERRVKPRKKNYINI